MNGGTNEIIFTPVLRKPGGREESQWVQRGQDRRDTNGATPSGKNINLPSNTGERIAKTTGRETTTVLKAGKEGSNNN